MITAEITAHLNAVGAEADPPFAAFPGRTTPGQRQGREDGTWVSVVVDSVEPVSRTADGAERTYSASCTLSIKAKDLPSMEATARTVVSPVKRTDGGLYIELESYTDVGYSGARYEAELEVSVTAVVAYPAAG